MGVATMTSQGSHVSSARVQRNGLSSGFLGASFWHSPRVRPLHIGRAAQPDRTGFKRPLQSRCSIAWEFERFCKNGCRFFSSFSSKAQRLCLPGCPRPGGRSIPVFCCGFAGDVSAKDLDVIEFVSLDVIPIEPESGTGEGMVLCGLSSQRLP